MKSQCGFSNATFIIKYANDFYGHFIFFVYQKFLMLKIFNELLN